MQGVETLDRDSENLELLARIRHSEQNNSLQQQLLHHMMKDQTDLEIDDLLLAEAEGWLVLRSRLPAWVCLW